MQCAIPVTAQPILPDLRHGRIPSLFPSSLAARTTVASKSKARARFQRLTLSAAAASIQAVEVSSGVDQFEDGEQTAEKQVVVQFDLAFPRLPL